MVLQRQVHDTRQVTVSRGLERCKAYLVMPPISSSRHSRIVALLSELVVNAQDEHKD